jgi:hypothetical protein
MDDSGSGTSMAFPRNRVADTVLDVADDNPAGTGLLEFGDPSPLSPDGAAIDWLWKCSGKLLVIAIPYIKGRHYATRPTDFLPIIEHLEYLHSRGYVHGDIRAYNMVFKDPELHESRGCLIDFDYGGKLVADETKFKASVTSVKYPANYKGVLEDGHRRGLGGQPIEFRDDWYALVQVILLIHNVTKVRTVTNAALSDMILREEVILREEKDSLLMMGGFSSVAGQEEMHAFVERLKTFLKAAETAAWVVNRSETFEQSLEGLVKPDAKSAHMAATGSPV